MGGVPPQFFLALQASVWSKNKRGPGAPSPFPRSATAVEEPYPSNIFLTTMFFLDLLWLLWVHLFIAQLPPSPRTMLWHQWHQTDSFPPIVLKIQHCFRVGGGRLPVLLIIITGKVPTYLTCNVSDAILSSFSSCQKCSQIWLKLIWKYQLLLQTA